VIASKKITAQPESIRPKQFTLDKLVSMATITATVGKGWDTPEASNYFSTDNDDTTDPMESLMTTLHSFEEANIIYSTMKQIKLTMNEKMRGCSSSNVTCQIMMKNQASRKRHSKQFKSDKYSFCPSDDLVKLLSFEFARTLKKDQFIPLPSKWLRNVNLILRKAEVNSIAKMKLFRLLRPNKCNKQPTESMDCII
jgi:hypothetical protein